MKDREPGAGAHGASPAAAEGARETIARHWPEYLMEAAGLGAFMLSAGVFGTLLGYPGSPIHRAIGDPFLRRALMGLLMGGTAVAIIYSPWGKRSGAHINPAVTVAFARLGKIAAWDAVLYVGAQFAGATLGVLVVLLVLGRWFLDPPVNAVATLPGEGGHAVAFVSELLISFLLMMTVLIATNTTRLARLTGLFAGALVALFITFEEPFSGMSMNPARTFGSALPHGQWMPLWIYFTAPLLGTLLAAETYARVAGRWRVKCAKLHHQNDQRCIFRCGYAAEAAVPGASAARPVPGSPAPGASAGTRVGAVS